MRLRKLGNGFIFSLTLWSHIDDKYSSAYIVYIFVYSKSLMLYIDLIMYL